MNDKVKSLFFSQYLGQEIFRINEHIPHVYELQGGHLSDKGYMCNCFLLLRDISQLTDVEILTLLNILGYYKQSYSGLIKRRIKNGNTFSDRTPFMQVYLEYVNHDYERDESIIANFPIENFDIHWCASNNNYYKSYTKAHEYLKAIGILLPFTYLSETNQPITLSTAEIINLCWAVITEV